MNATPLEASVRSNDAFDLVASDETRLPLKALRLDGCRVGAAGAVICNPSIPLDFGGEQLSGVDRALSVVGKRRNGHVFLAATAHSSPQTPPRKTSAGRNCPLYAMDFDPGT